MLHEPDGDWTLGRRYAYVATGTSLPRLSPDVNEALERLQLPFIVKPCDLASLCEVVAHAWAAQVAWSCFVPKSLVHQ